MKKKYYDGYTRSHSGRVFSDKELSKFVRKHLRLIDRLDIRRITEAVLISHNIFLEEMEVVTKKKNWKFYGKDVEFKWRE